MASVQPIQESFRVTKETVMDAIRAYIADQSKPFFTTLDIARHMGVDEYPVRAAVSWLARYGMIEIVPGVRSKRYLGQPEDPNKRRHTDSYSASVYQVSKTKSQADFATLNRVFCGGGN